MMSVGDGGGRGVGRQVMERGWEVECGEEGDYNKWRGGRKGQMMKRRWRRGRVEEGGKGTAGGGMGKAGGGKGRREGGNGTAEGSKGRRDRGSGTCHGKRCSHG
jgi:hypothetical protein